MKVGKKFVGIVFLKRADGTLQVTPKVEFQIRRGDGHFAAVGQNPDKRQAGHGLVLEMRAVIHRVAEEGPVAKAVEPTERRRNLKAKEGDDYKVDGDLRGMGRQLAGSTFNHLAITSARDETLLYNLNHGAYLSVQIAPGRIGSVSGQISALVRRVSALPDSSMRSSQS